jgi:hypothetical protein
LGGDDLPRLRRGIVVLPQSTSSHGTTVADHFYAPQLRDCNAAMTTAVASSVSRQFLKAHGKTVVDPQAGVLLTDKDSASRCLAISVSKSLATLARNFYLCFNQ